MEKWRAMIKGISISLMLYIPLSIISYFNEVQNACFDPFTNSCPQPPGYYHLPKFAALFLTFHLLRHAWREREDQGNHERDLSKGLALGTIIGFFMFFIFTMGGFWGWEHILF
ncbi:MAG: hypothetical protein CMA30_08315 [Euryarchaeota archaeon]|nr:hypothetical protein [Euryarchaeota archaeon]|tara:strand:+ start:368 stop:706 length:339 start_codon:yes stop_codon:yes gene_type:complete